MPGMRAVVALAALIIPVGCTSGQDASEPDPSPSASPAAAEDSPQDQALAAYVGIVEAQVEASHQGAQDHPYFERYAKGQALDFVREMLDGNTFSGEPITDPRVVEVDMEASPPTIVVHDCLSDATWVIEGTEPYDEDDPQRYRLNEATITEEEGVWQVERLWIEDPDSCQP